MNFPEPEPPRISRGEGAAQGLIIISFGSSTVCGDAQHLHELMMLIKKTLAEEAAS